MTNLSPIIRLLILTSISFIPVIKSNNTSAFTVGTVLFSSSDIQRQCWTQENMALLTTRMLMANLMPHTDKIRADDDSFISDIIEYFRLLLEVIRTNTNGKTKHIMLLAATDTMGGYMKHLIVPITKYSYYAGNIQYASIIRLYQLYDELKNFLRTNGEGWAKPWKNAGRHIQAKAISVQSPSPTSDPCKGIIYYKHSAAAPLSGRNKQESSEQKQCGMEVPLPFFDSKTHPAAIAVPFRTFGLRNLESRVSAYILVKYFVAVSKCMAARNTNDEDVHKFNANIFSFIVSKVMPHLGDEKFYAAFGGVLRILQTVTETTKAKGHAIGNMNIMAETQDREPPDLQEDEDIALGKSGKTGSTDRSRNNLILLAALATIIIWFCLGAAFVCCRIKAGKTRNEKAAIVDDENVCREETCPALYSSATSDNETPETPHTKVLYSIKQPFKKDKRKDSKSFSSKGSKKSFKSSKSTKSFKSHQTITSDLDSHSSNSPSSTGKEPVILRTRLPAVNSRERLDREHERELEYERQLERERGRMRVREEQRELERIREIEQEQCERERELERETEKVENFRAKQERQREERARERERERIEKDQQMARERKEEQKRLAKIQDRADREDRREANKEGDSAQIQVHSVQYYPPTFACHTSMTGKVKLDSTSTEVTSREDMKRPYVFGYDFQTTSEETSPRDATSDGENDMAGNASK